MFYKYHLHRVNNLVEINYEYACIVDVVCVLSFVEYCFNWSCPLLTMCFLGCCCLLLCSLKLFPGYLSILQVEAESGEAQASFSDRTVAVT